MTDKYSIEQIKPMLDWFEQNLRRSMQSQGPVFGDKEIAELKHHAIAELTRTQWKPQDKEVYAFRALDGSMNWRFISHTAMSSFNLDTERRSLTTNEVPAWKRDKETLKVAIGELKQIANFTIADGGANDMQRIALEVLTKIKEITSE